MLYSFQPACTRLRAASRNRQTVLQLSDGVSLAAPGNWKVLESFLFVFFSETDGYSNQTDSRASWWLVIVRVSAQFCVGCRHTNLQISMYWNLYTRFCLKRYLGSCKVARNQRIPWTGKICIKNRWQRNQWIHCHGMRGAQKEEEKRWISSWLKRWLCAWVTCLKSIISIPNLQPLPKSNTYRFLPQMYTNYT